MSTSQPQRRVRHHVADSAAVMLFSLGLSVVLAVVLAIALSAVGKLA